MRWNRDRPGGGGPLEGGEIGQGMGGRVAAHLGRRPQAVADRGALGAAEQPAPVALVELDAAHARRLAVRHPGDGRGDREGDAAGSAAGAAVHET